MKHILKEILGLLWGLLKGVFLMVFFILIGMPCILIDVIISLFDKEQRESWRTGGSVDDFGFPGDFQ